MPVERHGQDHEQDVIRQLQARIAECEQERARMRAAAMAEQDRLRGEIGALQARIAGVQRLLEAAEEAVPVIRRDGRAEGWQAGFAAGLAGQAAQPQRRDRWLRAVPGFAVPAGAAGWRVLRAKLSVAGLAVPAAAALVVAAPLAMHSAEFRGHVPGPGPGPSVTRQAFTPPEGGGGVVFPPDAAVPSPAASPSPAAVPASPAATASPPAAADTPVPPATATDPATDPATPAATETASPDPGPSGTPPPAESPAPGSTDTPTPGGCTPPPPRHRHGP